MKLRGIAGAVAAVLVLAGCATTGRPAYDTTAASARGDAHLVSGGVLRVQDEGGWSGDLTITRMSALDALPVVLPHCARAAVGRDPLYFDLNWRPAGRGDGVPAVDLSVSAPSGVPVTAAHLDGTCNTVNHLHIDGLDRGEQFVLQLVAPRSTDPHELGVRVGPASATLPLVHSCGDEPQPDDLSCTIDPVTYAAGSLFSQRLSVH